MRAAVLYPPLLLNGRIPVLTQSRIFSFTHSRQIRIYPLVMAQAATTLSRAGVETAWLDGIAAGWDPAEFWRRLEAFRPDLAVLETKVTMIRRHWAFIAELKARLPATRVAVVGDHVSYFPAETLRNSPADFVVPGGDYDAGLAALARHVAGESPDVPGGVWHRAGGVPAEAPGAPPVAELDTLPWIDRELTHWERYGEAYLHRPAAYILSGRGCGGVKGPGRCSFCIWQYAFWK
ncbi:MAG: hypothetical protein AAB368_16855, partial [bacterium]